MVHHHLFQGRLSPFSGEFFYCSSAVHILLALQEFVQGGNQNIFFWSPLLIGFLHGSILFTKDLFVIAQLLLLFCKEGSHFCFKFLFRKLPKDVCSATETSDIVITDLYVPKLANSKQLDDIQRIKSVSIFSVLHQRLRLVTCQNCGLLVICDFLGRLNEVSSEGVRCDRCYMYQFNRRNMSADVWSVNS